MHLEFVLGVLVFWGRKIMFWTLNFRDSVEGILVLIVFGRGLLMMGSCGFVKGFVDEQFTQIQMLQDEANPNFVIEVVTIFYNDCDRLVDNMEKAL